MITTCTWLFVVNILLALCCCKVSGLQDQRRDVSINHSDILFIILSQNNNFHAQQAEEAKKHLQGQALALQWTDVRVILTHISWPNEVGMWTIFPIFEKLLDKKFLANYPREPNWIFIADEGTRVNLRNLISIIENLNPKQDIFMGKALKDKEATIIHHFAFHDNPSIFLYPDLAAGILLSWSLILKLQNRLNTSPFIDELNFSIDPQHELSLFIWDDGNGVSLTDNPKFCTESEDEECATYYVLGQIPLCVKPVALSDIFIAVKTCKKFEERVTILLQTWATTDLDLTFFGDVSNNTHGQNIVNLKVENTERGHCGKTMEILHYVANNYRLKSKSWLVITDDDTLMSVSRLRNQLSCYNWMDKIALGQRYGFRTAASEGYDYMTGGAGMVLSMSALKYIVESGSCKCPTADTPDDMYLGICLKRLNIPLIHSHYFHQARPNDYSLELLSHQQPVTFHKFWMIDALKTYKEWFTSDVNADEDTPKHNEL